MTLLVLGAKVTVPVAWLIMPDEEAAMSSVNEGSSKSTCPDGDLPLNTSETARPVDEILRFSLLPSVVGKLLTEIDAPSVNHCAGTPRPTIKVPSELCVTSESNKTLLAWDIPHVWGEEPWPAAGCFPIHGVFAEGALELSHHEYGPLWLFSIMNS